MPDTLTAPPAPAAVPAAPAAAAPAPAAPVAAPPAPPAKLENGGLPRGVQVNSDYDPGEHFDKFKAAQVVEAGAARPAAADAPAAEPAPVAEPPAAPAKGSLAAKLAAKATPAPIEPAAPVAAAPVANPEDSVTLASEYSKPAHESFAQIKGIAKGLRDQNNVLAERVKAAEAKLAASAAGTAPANVEEITTLRTENKRLSDRLMLVDLREHPQFTAEFVAPRDAALTEAQALLTANGVADVNVSDLLSKPRAEFGKAVSEAAKSLSAFDQTDFAASMRSAYALKQQGDAALGRSREVYAGMRSQTEGAQRQAFDATWNEVNSGLAEHIVKLEAPENATAAEIAEVDAFNRAVAEVRPNAERIAFGAAGPKDVSRSAMKAAAYDFHIQYVQPRVLKEYSALQTLNAQMAAELRAIKSRNPNHAMRAPVGESGSGSADPKNMDHDAAAAHWMAQPQR